MKLLRFFYFIVTLILANNIAWAAPSNGGQSYNRGPTSVIGPPLESFLHEQHGLGANLNQYAITMNTTVMTVRTLVITGMSEGDCTGTAEKTATMTAGSDETFSAGTTYSANDASSWAVVSSDPEGWYGPVNCIKYEFKNSAGAVLHTTTCNNNWYAAGQGPNDYCTSSSSCGQRYYCVDTWS